MGITGDTWHHSPQIADLDRPAAEWRPSAIFGLTGIRP
jgi:hypothetical protein